MMNLAGELWLTLQRRNLALMAAKQAYFRWREGWINSEKFDSYIDEDHERRAALGITEQDEREWRQRYEPLPF